MDKQPETDRQKAERAYREAEEALDEAIDGGHQPTIDAAADTVVDAEFDLIQTEAA